MKSIAYTVKQSNRHYRGKPSNNAVALKAGLHRGTRRRRVMSIRKATYEQVKLLLVEKAGEPGMPAKSSIPNLISALQAFMHDLGFTWNDPVGTALRDAYEVLRDQHLVRCAEAGRSRAYIKNRASMLNTWHHYLLHLDYEGASITGDLNPLQQKLRPLMDSVRSVTQLAKDIGVGRQTLTNWVFGGRMPRTCNEIHLERLETYFCLEPGELLATLPRHQHKKKEKKVPKIAHRENVKEWTKAVYKLRPRQIPEDHVLRTEWLELVRAKVEFGSPELEIEVGEVLSNAFTTMDEKSWRTRPIREHWKNPKMMAKKWPQILGDSRVPSASRVFNHVSAFLGWLILNPKEGGQGMTLAEISLGLLINKTYLLKYIDWYATRAKQVHGGHLNFVDAVLSFVHPEDGPFLTLSEIGARVGYDSAAWRAHCVDIHTWLTETVLPGIKNGYRKYGMGRKPFEAILPILELNRPQDAIVRALNKAQAARPTTGSSREVAWARDNALIALLLSCPLRLENIVAMTYKPDNTGHLRQTATGQWRIFIPAEELKTGRSSKRNGDYNQAVDPAVVPFITQYLRVYRPMLGGPKPELIFVSTYHPEREYDRLDRCVRNWTKRYVDNVDSFGPHAFRHIVATHILKTTNANFELAAKVLHDSRQTVERYYAHLLHDFVDNGCRGAYSGSMSNLKPIGAPHKSVAVILAQRELPARRRLPLEPCQERSKRRSEGSEEAPEEMALNCEPDDESGCQRH